MYVKCPSRKQVFEVYVAWGQYVQKMDYQDFDARALKKVLSCFNTPVTPQVWPLLWMKDYKKKKLKNLYFRLRQAHSNDIF